MAYTVDQLVAYAAEHSGMATGANTDDRNLLDQFVNDAITEVFLETHCVVTRVNVGLVTGEDEYEIDTGILAIKEYAQLSSAPTSTLSVATAEELLQRRFSSSVGTVRRFAVLGANILIVSPAPAEDDEIIFYVVPVPDAVASTADIHTTGLPVFARRAVQCFVIWKAMENNKDYESANYWHSEFDKECGKVRKRARNLAGRKLPVSRIGYPDKWRVPYRNDTYPEHGY